MSDRRPKRSPITVRKQADGSYILTAGSPKDGVGRETSAADLHYPMTLAELRKFQADLAWLLAGAE